MTHLKTRLLGWRVGTENEGRISWTVMIMERFWLMLMPTQHGLLDG